jgi:hypothetical protein
MKNILDMEKLSVLFADPETGKPVGYGILTQVPKDPSYCGDCWYNLRIYGLDGNMVGGMVSGELTRL